MRARLAKGFTLVELLVVIAIIGLLAGIVIASLNGSRKKGRDARRVADIRAIQLAVESYFQVCNQFPPNIHNTSINTGCSGTNLGTYLPAIPVDPLGVAYSYSTYASPGALFTCTGYHLGAALEDTTNKALTDDSDKAPGGTGCSNSDGDFDGTSANAGSCSSTAGTPQPGGTERCYDLQG